MEPECVGICTIEDGVCVGCGRRMYGEESGEIMTTQTLPEGMVVLQRGWLSSNSVLLRGTDGWTLVDSGYVTKAGETLALLDAAVGGEPIVRLVNTHSHSDHLGGNAAVARRFGCSIWVPEGLADPIGRWDEAALLLSTAGQRAEPFSYSATIAAGDTIAMGQWEWRAISVPGHDMHALAYFEPTHGVLISGDALWEDGFGILFPSLLGQADAIAAAREALAAIERLPVRWVIPGHGAPFEDVAAALQRAWGRLEAFANDPRRIARNALRACVTFTLLERGCMQEEELRTTLAGVELFQRALDWIELTPEEAVRWLGEELERAGAIRRAEGQWQAMLPA